MKTRPFLVTITTLFFSTSALAAPVFMLQFGSFESRAEADARLAEIKTKHAGLVGNLTASVREVTLPPDNLTVYRTQAGPLPNRAAAQSVCSQLATNGDQCYVVETAMMGTMPSGAPANATATGSPALALTALPPVASVAAPNMTPPSVELPSMPQPAMPQAAPSLSVADEMAQGLAAATPTQPMHDALAQAATQQETMAAGVNTALEQPQAEVKKQRSFWSRMNPFSSDDEPLPAPPKPVVAEAAPITAPVEPVLASNAPPPLLQAPAVAPPVATAATPFVVDPTMPPPPRPVPPEAPASVLPLQAADRVAPPAPVVPAAAPSLPPSASLVPPPQDTGSMLLPPPPPPLRAQDRTALAAGQMPAPAAAAAVPIATPAPASAAPFAAPLSVVSPTVSAPAPLSAPAVPSTLPPTLMAQATNGLGQKTLWAEMGDFSGAQEALAFWESYRAAHPDFPVVRTRVISPYQSAGDGRVSLRVGPFARAELIRNLCATVQSPQLRCGTIIDLGVASPTQGSTSNSGSRYQR